MAVRIALHSLYKTILNHNKLTFYLYFKSIISSQRLSIERNAQIVVNVESYSQNGVKLSRLRMDNMYVKMGESVTN